MSSGPTARPESPTTSREPTFDDTPDVSELEIGNTAAAKSGGATPTVADSNEKTGADGDKPAGAATGVAAVPATLLAGLVTRQEKEAFASLYEAFPAVDGRVIRAVLRAAGFKPERAFEPLLEYSDPEYRVEEPTPPAPPPRPSRRTQLETDEALARRLADEFNRESATAGRRSRDYPSQQNQSRQHDRLRRREEEEDEGPSFFDDDLPKLGAQIQQSFFEARGKVSEMLSGLKKRMDGEDDYPPERTPTSANQTGSRVSYDDYGYPSDNYAAAQRDHAGGHLNPSSRSSIGGGVGVGAAGAGTGPGRSSSLYRNPNYDADPRVLTTDDLYADSFRNSAASPLGSGSIGGAGAGGNGGRATSPAVFASSSPQPRLSGEAGAAGKKWQPISSMPPAPARDRDPFELGDSDDEDAPASRKIQLIDKEAEATEKKG